MSGWYSLVGVFAQLRMMSTVNMEKPMMMTVRQVSVVLSSTLPFFRVANMPQMQSASNATRKKAAPLLYGSPSVFTKKRSK